MRPVVTVAAAVSKLLARMDRWSLTAALLARFPLAQLDATSVGRLRYALLMMYRSDPHGAQQMLQRLLSGNAGISPELQIELAAMATAVHRDDLANEQLSRAMHGASSTHTADAAKTLWGVTNGLADGSLQNRLHTALDALHLPDGLLTLVPVSGRYLALWGLWFQQTRRHVGGSIVVIAMDDEAIEALRGEANVFVLDLRAFFAWDNGGKLHQGTRGVLWLLRVMVLRDLVRRGHPVLVLDLDAIAVADVAPMLAALPNADVVAQKDHSIPMDVNRQLGFVLCCGVMLWRPTVAAGRLLDRLAEATALERDDQLALNHLIAADGVADRSEDATGLRYTAAGVQFACPPAAAVSRTLVSGSVIRHFHQQGQSMSEIRQALGLR